VPTASLPRPLCILIASIAPERIGCAIRLAMAQAALGGAATLYFDEAAAPALLHTDLAEPLAMGVRVIACQTGAAAHGVDLSTLPPAVEAGGMVSLLAELADARLLVV
jgi:hypothetical protein